MARFALVAVPIILMLGAIVSPVQAGHDENRVIVQFTDLDLTRPEGRATLDHRLEHAIRNVCRAPFSRSVRVASEARQCMEEVRRRLINRRNAVIARAKNKAASATKD